MTSDWYNTMINDKENLHKVQYTVFDYCVKIEIVKIHFGKVLKTF